MKTYFQRKNIFNIANAFASTFYFFADTQANAKKNKMSKPTHGDTANLTRHSNERQEARTANSTYKKLAVQWLNEALCFVPSFVVADSLVLRNRQLLVAAKRYAALYETRNQ